MSHSIDERVVEMRFNNKQFEEETRKTMGTLERLKEALKFTKSGEGLKKLEKTASDIRLDGIATSVDMLAKRFSTFGIIGMRVIQNITDAFMGKLAGAVNYVSDAIVSGGIKRAFNIENAHFQLQALLKDETKVQAVMADAMEAVDGTAYAYDEAAKAASQFAASGIQAGEDMLGALKGITGVAAMTNSSFEDISAIFTTVAGNGRLMGDQLLQLSSRGLNAASTLVDYFKEVQGQANITEGDVRNMVTKGEISFKMFADAMTYAFGDSAKRANETFNGALSNMRSAFTRIGAGFISPLIEQNGVLVDLFNSLRVRINEIKGALVFDSATSSVEGFAKTMKMSGDEAQEFYNKIKDTGHVTAKNIEEIKKGGQDGYSVIADYMNKVSDGSIRTGYAVTSSINEISKGAQVSADDVAKFVKKGKVSYDIFSESFEHAFGTQHQKLSKRFTDFVIRSVDSIRTWVDNTDLTKPMELVNKSVDILIHSVQALGKVLSPVGTAFYNVFLKDFSFGITNMVEGANRIDSLIQNFKLSESASSNLRKTFTGLFDILALVGDGFLALVGAILPFGRTAKEAGGGVLQLAGNLGQALSNFSQWVRTSPKVEKAFVIFQKSIQNVSKGLVTVGNGIWDFITMVSKLPQTTAIMNTVGDIFSGAGSIIETVCDNIVTSVGAFIDSLGKIDFTDPRTMMKSFGDAVESLAKSLMKYDSIRIFITNFKDFLNNLGNAFSKDNITGKINGVKGAFDTLGNGIKVVWSYLKPIFDQISLGGVVAAGTGVGIMASMFKISKALESVAESVKSVPNVLGAVKNTLEAYQKDLKAKQIKDIAAAIALLSGAVLLLSFADPKNVMASATALTMIAGALLGGGSALLNALNKTKTLPDVLNTFAKGISKSLKNLTAAVKWKAIGSAVKSLGETILMIGVTLVVIALMWRKDPQAMDQALFYVGTIAAGIIGMITVMSAAGSIMGRGMKSFQKAATGVLEIAAAMFIIVAAVDKIMKMEIPSDFESRMDIFKDVFSGLMVLTLVVAAASKLAGGNSLSLTGPIVGLCAMLMVSVSSLKKLFKMDVPDDWKRRFFMLEGIFASLSGITLVVAAAARIAGGNKIGSAAAPILALSVLLFTATASLKKVMSMELPSDWLLRFGMLEILFVTLGSITKSIGKAVKEGNGGLKAAGSILAMCALLATATGSLMVLSMISWPGLLKGAVSLGIVLVGLATTFTAVGEISNDNAYKAVLAMAATIGSITASLAVLSMISVPNLIKSGVALGTMLLAMAGDFVAISKITNDKVWIDILAMIAAMTAVTAALVVLSSNPWENLIAAGTSLGLVVSAFAVAFGVISKTGNINVAKAGIFSLASLALVPMAVGLAVLANQPMAGILSAAVALSELMLAMSAALAITAKCNVNVDSAIQAVLSIDIFLADLIGVLTVLGGLDTLTGGGFSKLIGDGGNVLEKVGEAFGKLISGFGAGLASQLPSIGLSLSAFAVNILPFITVMNGVKAETVDGVNRVVDMVLSLSVASFISGVTNLLTLGNGFSTLGERLVEFAGYIKDFGEEVKYIDAAKVTAAAAAGSMIAGLYDALPKEGGWMQKIFGESMSLADFGDQLTAFGEAIVPFAEQVKDVNAEAVSGAVAAGEAMAGLYDNLPKEDGWMQTIFGSTMSLGDFGEQLKQFGEAVVPFADKVKDVKKSAVKGAAAIGEMFADLATKLPNEGGSLMENIFGSTMGLGDFGSELINFGQYVVLFADKVKDVKSTSVIGAANIGTIMSNIANNLPETNGKFKDWFGGGTMKLSDFGAELLAFAPNLVEFAEQVSDISENQVSGAMKALTLVTDTLSTVTMQDSGGTTLAQFGAQLEKFGSSLKKFYKEMKNTDFSNITSITTNIKKLVSVAKDAAEGSVDAFTKGFNSSGGSVIKAMNSMINKAMSALKAGHTGFKENGRAAGKNFVSGVNAGIAAQTTAINTAAKKLGKNYAQGFAQGIRETQNTVVAAARSMAEAADQAVAKSLDEHSPSKLAKKRGKWYTQGFAKGIKESKFAMMHEVEVAFQQVNHTAKKNLRLDDILSDVTSFFRKTERVVDASRIAKAMSDKIAMINLSLYGMSDAAKLVSYVVMDGFNKMSNNVAKAYKNIEKAEKAYNEAQKSQAKAEEAQQKREEKLKEEYDKWVDYYSKSKKERAEAAKEAKKQAKIEAKAYEKVYGKPKEEKKEFLDFNSDYYKKMLKIVRTGNNKILYEDKSLEEAEIDILKRVTDAYNSYMDQYKQARESFMNQVGFFDEVQKKESNVSVNMFSEVSKNEAKSKEELFQIANDQITLYQDFVKTQTVLLARLEGTALADYIRDMGVDSYSQLEVINNMTEQELRYYATLYENTYAAVAKTTKTDILTKDTLLKNARDQVQLYEEFVKTQQQTIARLKGTALGDYVMTLGVDQKEEMDAILSMTDAELNEYIQLYDQKFALSGVAAKNQLANTQAEVEQSILDMLQGVVNNVNLWDWNFDGTIESLINTTKTTEKKAEKVAKDSISKYAKALAKYGKESIGVGVGVAIAANISAENIATMLKKKQDMVEVVTSVVKDSGKKNEPVAKKTGKNLGESAIQGMKSMNSKFFNVGKTAGEKVADGLRSQASAVRAAADELQRAASAMSSASAQANSMDLTRTPIIPGDKLETDAKNTGAAVSSGLASGMQSAASSVVQSAALIGALATGALRDSLGVHSPSKVAIEIGDFTTLGFIKGLVKNLKLVAKAGVSIGETAESSIENGLDDIYEVFDAVAFDWSPVIRPTVDLSNVERSVNDITQMFNDAIRAATSDLEITAATINGHIERDISEPEVTKNVTNTYTFHQENHSPKALSRIDIYRDTKNQFAQFREAVEQV